MGNACVCPHSSEEQQQAGGAAPAPAQPAARDALRDAPPHQTEPRRGLKGVALGFAAEDDAFWREVGALVGG